MTQPHTLTTTTTSNTWHDRLVALVQKCCPGCIVAQSSLVLGGTHKHLCHAYHLGRDIRLFFPSSSQVVHVFLSHTLWFMDLLVLNVSGYKYYLVVLDYYSHYSWIFPLCLKSDTFITLISSLGFQLSWIAPFWLSSVTMEVSSITLPPMISFFPTVFSYGCHARTPRSRTVRLAAWFRPPTISCAPCCFEPQSLLITRSRVYTPLAIS